MNPAPIGRAAVRALYQELTLEPKPGLVSPRDSGSHADMDAATFMRSLFALRGYFVHIIRAGAARAPFSVLESLGRGAEARMLVATGGINTHRGAVFALGLLCAAFGAAASERRGALTAAGVRDALRTHWGAALQQRAQHARRMAPASNGQHAARRYGLRSAADEAAAAFPVLFDVTLPALRAARRAGAGDRAARVQALFSTIAVLHDTNIAHRGGFAGLLAAQQAARSFLDAGGVFGTAWLPRARAVHAHFVEHRWSPGGAADLLGCACWLDAVCQAEVGRQESGAAAVPGAPAFSGAG